MPTSKKSSIKKDESLKVVVKLLLRLEETLTGSTPASEQVDIRDLYRQLKEANQ